MRKQIPLTSWWCSYRLAVNKSLVTLTLILLSILHVSAQDIPVTGRVTSSDGEGIPGVTVVVKGTATGTVTDFDGNYTISVPDSNATLVFSYVGFVTQEIALGGKAELNVAMSADTQAEELVVIGYGTQKKEDVTGSVATVEAKDLNRVVVPDPAQAIQGRAPGVAVTQNSGAPGAPLSVRIRGVGTINNSDPLYVVNGVPVGDIGFLNSNDIASISILKDASAAAVYGSRAANGVVVVTTKSGSEKETTFDFNYLTGVSREWKRYDLLNAREWATLRNEAQMAANGTTIYNVDSIENAVGEGTDWQDQIFRSAVMKSYQLGASGGSDKATYYLSGSYLKQEGILKNSDFQRYNINANGDYQLAKRLKVGSFMNIGFINRSQLYDGDPYNSIIANALTADPLTPVYSGRGGDSLYASGQARTDVPNPLARLTYYNNKFKGINFLGRWYGEYEFIPDLKLKSSLGYAYSSITNNQFNGKYYVSNVEQLNESQVIAQQNNGRQVIWENSLEYKKTLGTDHEVGGLFMVGLQDNRGEYFRVQRNNTPSNDPSMQFLDNATGTATVSGNAAEWALLSYLIRVNYSFKGKYLLTANARRDGTSRFPEDSRWGTFPSVAAGWVISEESLFEPMLKYANFLKLRASWGKLGNQNIPGGDYPYTTNISSGYNYAFGSSMASGSTPLGAGNTDIRWESVTTSNVGLDFGFFNNRLALNVDYFTRKTTDMLYRRSVPGYTGVEEPPYVNDGEMINRGFEVYTEYNNKIGALEYRVGANLTKVKNEVTKLDDPIYGGQYRTMFTNITQEGSPIAQFYGYETDGIVQTDEEATNLQTLQPGVKPGDFKFKDNNNNGVIDDGDRTVIGSPLPKFVYGFNGDVSYKGFDLSIFFQGTHGNQIFNGSKFQLEGGVPYSNFSNAMLGRWHGEGTSNDVPRVTTSDVNNNRRVSDYYVEDGSYMRIKSVQLGYTIPDNIAEIVKLQKLRVFLMAQNLFTFTKYSGLDPEIGTYTPDFSNTDSYLDIGVDKGGTYPQARTFLIGVNASF